MRITKNTSEVFNMDIRVVINVKHFENKFNLKDNKSYP